MGNVIIIPENLMANQNSDAVAATEASASMTDSNMVSEVPSKFWRSESNWPTKCSSYFYMKTGSGFNMNTIAVVNHNLLPGDQYRFWVNESSTLATRPTGATLDNPNGYRVGETSNTAANPHLLVDNGETLSPSTWAVPTLAASPWSICLKFPTPAGIINGEKLHAFWCFVKAEQGPPSGLPTIQCELWENGVLLEDLGTRRVSSTTGQVMCFPFKTDNLSVTDGSLIECKLTMVPRSITQYVSVGSVVRATDRDARTGDSGWITYNPFVGTDIAFKPTSQLTSGVILHQFPLTYTPFYVHMHIRSSRSLIGASESVDIPATTPNYVQIGTVVIGEAWSPTINIAYGKLTGIVDSSPIKRTYGGGIFGSRRVPRRVLSVHFAHLSPDECHTLFDRILWRHGVMKPFIVSLLPDDTTQAKHTTIFGHIRNAENWINIQPEQGYENNIELEFEEVL